MSVNLPTETTDGNPGWDDDEFVSPHLCVSICLSVCLSLDLSVWLMSVCLANVSLSGWLSETVCLLVCMSVCLSINVFFCPSGLSVCLSIDRLSG